MDTASLVKLIRKNAGLTQVNAAKIIGVTPRTWERWEAGTMQPTPAFLELFCMKTGQDFNKINIEKKSSN